MESFINQIFQRTNIAYAIFNNNLELTKKSENLEKVLGQPVIEKNNSFFDIFPEFFGSEDEIASILSGRSEQLNLEKINKYDIRGNLHYINFLVITPKKRDETLLVIVSDSTDKSALEQRIRQKNNEIKILVESIAYLKNDSMKSLLGKSDVIKELKQFIRKMANIKGTTILLTGESGTGKTLIAKAIHNSSDSSNSPFVEINCATIPSTLLESEIFGHIKGAFTNAVDNKKGLLEEADGGTLFLDEIGELPLSVQPKFLSFLESKKFRRVGSTKEIIVNTRIIAATNKDLKRAVELKEFRDDLYYRINVVSLNIPPLRDRDEDIIILAQYFVKHFAIEFNKNVSFLTKRAEEKLLSYSWPGNIRELKNIIERAVIFCDKDFIGYEDLIISENDLKPTTDIIVIPEDGISLNDLEKKYLVNALKKAEGNQTNAAKLLHLSLDTFRYRIKKHDISTDVV